MQASVVKISIIVPVYNNGDDLQECVAALTTSLSQDGEIIVVDDASNDDSAAVAERMGVRVCRLTSNLGVSAARNYGANMARGDILLFVDADVVVAPGMVARVAEFFQEHSDVAAVFGSYDALPRGNGIVSRYRNLLHHFVHQHGNPEASTFWAGCGAIRRAVFHSIGGFDEQRFKKPSIEDIELGYRLREAGHRIILDKGLQAKHLKNWTLASMIKTDVFSRAIPWSRLILERKNAPNDLNLRTTQRFSGSLVMLGFPLLPLGAFEVEFFAIAGILLGSVAFLNRDLYVFFFRRHGFRFAAICILLHLLYYLYSSLSYLIVWVTTRLSPRFLGRPSVSKA